MNESVPISKCTHGDGSLMAKFGSGPHDTCGHLGQEVERGNVEYKLQLVGISGQRRLHLVTQLNWRLHEGGGAGFL